MVYVKPKQKQTKELELLHAFKDSDFFEKYTSNLVGNYIFLEEPYTGFGYPDMVLLVWNDKIQENWNDERNNLTVTDVKIVQHLYNCNEWKTIADLSIELGFSERQLKKILKNLNRANMVENHTDYWKLNAIEDIFFIENIITIEAKLKNWRKALLQSANSEFFSSQVFSLFPDNTINNDLLDCYSNTDIGVVTYNHTYEIVKPANRKNLPITINGWLFNEFIGRMLWQDN